MELSLSPAKEGFTVSLGRGQCFLGALVALGVGWHSIYEELCLFVHTEGGPAQDKPGGEEELQKVTFPF